MDFWHCVNPRFPVNIPHWLASQGAIYDISTGPGGRLGWAWILRTYNTVLIHSACILNTFCIGNRFNLLTKTPKQTNTGTVFQNKIGVLSVYAKFQLPSSVTQIYLIFDLANWHELAAFQRSAFRRSTAGNDVVATIFLRLWGPLAAILDFAGGAALQAVSERPLRR